MLQIETIEGRNSKTATKGTIPFVAVWAAAFVYEACLGKVVASAATASPATT